MNTNGKINRTTRILRRVLGMVIVLSILAACSSNVTTRIMTFRDDSTNVPGGTVRIRPVLDEMAGTQQFKYFTQGLAQKLEQLGLRVVEEGKTDYILELGFVVNRREADDRGHSSVYISSAYGGYRRGGGFGVLLDGDKDKDFEFERIIDIALLKAPVQAGADPHSLVEVAAVSVGNCDILQRVYPQMLDAIFKDFYRANGSTVSVKVPIESDNCRTRRAGS